MKSSGRLVLNLQAASFLLSKLKLLPVFPHGSPIPGKQHLKAGVSCDSQFEHTPQHCGGGMAAGEGAYTPALWGRQGGRRGRQLLTLSAVRKQREVSTGAQLVFSL